MIETIRELLFKFIRKALYKSNQIPLEEGNLVHPYRGIRDFKMVDNLFIECCTYPGWFSFLHMFALSTLFNEANFV